MKLADVNSSAESQMRVVDFYDSLLRNHASLEDILRATAGLAGIRVGVKIRTSGEEFAFSPTGVKEEQCAIPNNVQDQCDVVFHGRTVATVWLDDPDRGTDELRSFILERLALTCEVLWDVDGLGSVGRALEKLLEVSTPKAQLKQCVTALGRKFPRYAAVVALVADEASVGPAWKDAALTRFANLLSVGKSQLFAFHGSCSCWVIVPSDKVDLLRPIDIATASVGPIMKAEDLAKSRHLADAALQYNLESGEKKSLVRYEDVGVMCLLPIKETSAISFDPAVAALIEALEEFPESADILGAYLTCGGIRAAARHLRRHHSSVANSIARFEDRVGFTLRDSHSLFAAKIGLAYWALNHGSISH